MRSCAFNQDVTGLSSLCCGSIHFVVLQASETTSRQLAELRLEIDALKNAVAAAGSSAHYVTVSAITASPPDSKRAQTPPSEWGNPLSSEDAVASDARSSSSGTKDVVHRPNAGTKDDVQRPSAVAWGPGTADSAVVPNDEDEQVNEQELEHCLEASIWDVSLLMGLQPVGMGATAFLAFLMVMNVCMQGFFTFVVATALTTPAITDASIEQYRD